MLTEPPKNTMMTSAPAEKAGFHFPGDGIFHNAYIWAVNIEEATKEYLATRVPISLNVRAAVAETNKEAPIVTEKSQS